MGRENFEDIVGRKFEGQGHHVPERVWDNVNNSLNAELVSQYQASYSWHKWLTAAAILIAISSFAIHYSSRLLENINNQEESVSYNALLSDDLDVSQFNAPELAFDQTTFYWTPIVISKEELEPVFISTSLDSDEKRLQLLSTIEIQAKKPSIELAEANHSINPFYRTLNSLKSKTSKKNEFWAGLEAGAGKFNPDFSGSSSISSSVNSAAAATAVGAGGFSNPSASAVQNGMNEGTATSVGFDFGMKLGEKWTLESGLAYTNINNRGSASINVFDQFSTLDAISTGKIEPASLKPAERERADTQTSFDGDVDINSNLQFASLPLKAGYFLMDNRFSLRLNAGVAANYLIENSLSDPSRQIINGSQNSLYNDWSFDGIGGLEFGYRLFDKIDMTIEPNYRYSITPLSNTINSPSRFVVQTGFRYTLR